MLEACEEDTRRFGYSTKLNHLGIRGHSVVFILAPKDMVVAVCAAKILGLVRYLHLAQHEDSRATADDFTEEVFRSHW